MTSVTGSVPQAEDVNYALALPKEISSNVLVESYTVCKLSYVDIIEEVGGNDIDIRVLLDQFGKFCYDFRPQGDYESSIKYYALGFFSKIIYTIGPAARSVKQGTGDKTWRFIIPSSETSQENKFIFVSTYKTGAYKKTDTGGDKYMMLTIKQASLIAISIMESVVKLAYEYSNGVYLLTPLAGAIFSKLDITDMSDMVRIMEPSHDATYVVRMINASCQPGGHYLPSSNLDCAMVASIVATSAMKDMDQRRSIISKTIRQYITAGKTYNRKLFDILAGFASGGVPADLDFDNILKYFSEAKAGHISKISAMRAQKGSTAKSNVLRVDLPPELPELARTKYVMEPKGSTKQPGGSKDDGKDGGEE